jgi:site-specific recombinase XerD
MQVSLPDPTRQTSEAFPSPTISSIPTSQTTRPVLAMSDTFNIWPDILLLKIIQPAALRAGIKKRVGWHTFRHSYCSFLVANGENVKVIQELMRHASSRLTLDVYSQARKGAKRHAQQRVVQMILPEKFDDAVPAISPEGRQNDAA